MAIPYLLLRGFLVLAIGAGLGIYLVANLHDDWTRSGDPQTRRQAQDLLGRQLQNSPYDLVDFRLSERTREDSYHLLGEVRWRDQPDRKAPFVGVLVQRCAEPVGAECWGLERFEVIPDLTRVARVPIIDETGLSSARQSPDDGLGAPLASNPVPVMGSWQGADDKAAPDTLAFAPRAGEMQAMNDSDRPGRGEPRGALVPRASGNGHLLEPPRVERAETPDSAGPETAAAARMPQPDWQVSAHRVNVRAGPGVSHAVLTTLGEGGRLHLEERKNRWGRFTWQDGEKSRSGWIFLELVAPLPSNS